jgi:hypothetical protein
LLLLLLLFDKDISEHFVSSMHFEIECINTPMVREQDEHIVAL